MLTGLRNRAELEIATAGWHGGRAPSALLCLDIDRFKSVNDDHGHPAGDEVLRITASRVIAQLRPSDGAYRLGDDECLIVIGEPATRDALAGIAQRMLAAIAEPMGINGARFDITASIGATLATTTNFDVLLRDADAALYAAKRQGRARVVMSPDFASLPSVALPSPAGDSDRVPAAEVRDRARARDGSSAPTPR